MWNKFNEIVTQKVIDRERIPTFANFFACTDKDMPELTSTKHIRVVVVDINDEPPVFTQTAPYNAGILENNKPNYFLVQVTATDRDQPETKTQKLLITLKVPWPMFLGWIPVLGM
jgi:hypothetical protein